MIGKLATATFSFILLTLPLLAVGSAVGKTGLRGYVLSFDQKYVWLESGNQKVEVPRKYAPKNLKAGELLVVEVDQTELDGFKKTTIKKTAK